MDRKEAIFILVTNLKGRRDKREPLTRIAEAIETVLEKDFDGKVNKLARSYKVTPQIINEFRKVSNQPPEIRKMIAERKLGLDASTKLYTIADTRKRIALARAVKGLNQYDIRSIIDYSKMHPDIPADKVKRTILESKTVTEDIHALVIPLDAGTFEKLSRFAGEKRLRLEDAAKLAITRLLKSEGEGKE